MLNDCCNNGSWLTPMDLPFGELLRKKISLQPAGDWLLLALSRLSILQTSFPLLYFAGFDLA